MPIVTCIEDGCEHRMIANDEDVEGYCPDHAGSWWSSQDHERQAADQRAAENRHHVVANDRNTGGLEARR